MRNNSDRVVSPWRFGPLQWAIPAPQAEPRPATPEAIGRAIREFAEAMARAADDNDEEEGDNDEEEDDFDREPGPDEVRCNACGRILPKTHKWNRSYAYAINWPCCGECGQPIRDADLETIVEPHQFGPPTYHHVPRNRRDPTYDRRNPFQCCVQL